MQDFLLNEDGSMKIENGDFVIGNCDMQNKSLLLSLAKGSIKKNPISTVGISNYLESEDSAAMLREIRTRFSADGMDVKQLGFTSDGKLSINAPYIE